MLSLVERGGEVRSFHVGRQHRAEVIPIVEANVAKEAAVMTDAASSTSTGSATSPATTAWTTARTSTLATRQAVP